MGSENSADHAADLLSSWFWDMNEDGVVRAGLARQGKHHQ
jgi:hypothetical protein